MENTRAFLRAHAQHDTDRAIERCELLCVHLASLGAVLYKCNMTLEQELNQMRADSALVVRALDCALVLINGLILFLPHGMVQPPELGGMKQQLDDAMAMIRRREATPDLPPGMIASSMAASQPVDGDFETAVLLEAGSKVIGNLQDKTRALEAEMTTMGVLLDGKTAEIERLTKARDIACYNITELSQQKEMLTGVLTDALTLVDYTIGELRNNNVVPSAALQIAYKQFNEKMRKLLQVNREMRPQ
jgi:hypothetical protein